MLKTFKNNLFEVGVKLDNGEVLFDVEQVAKSLGFTQVKGDKTYIRWTTVNNYLQKYLSQDVGKGDLIPESLVYKLAFKASNDAAEAFQDWLSIEVVPSIRKHGGFLTAEKIEEVLLDPDTLIKLATNLKEERERRIHLENQIQVDRPYTNFAKSIAHSSDSITIGEFSKILANTGIRIGRNRLFNWLREQGYLIKRGREKNNPQQVYIDRGFFQLKESIVHTIDGDLTRTTTLLTGKGQLYLLDKLKEAFCA
ncbi:phage antirepressor Ant [Bacillus mycoides]|uniref:phage antirepressor KilAC domain-containing protein n=1 Tax=Bacillus mycoides TaxID=1405 RepID=UPI0002799143|nr:phage antirepressor KilAC domain-containing protein [Bacillus mycoides]EJS15347.1 hypothetical protein IKS_02006 [Bacillus cereus VDM062]QWI23236.1 phage antirepressor Ant [Bacillus mycoides]